MDCQDVDKTWRNGEGKISIQNLSAAAICPGLPGNTIFAMTLGFPGVSDGKESTCNAGDLGSVPGLGRSLGGGHGKPLQYSCLENPHGQRNLVSYTTEPLSIAHARCCMMDDTEGLINNNK